ncbi:hypothetical protein CEP54_011650 [Fusarium duplospermum]|uniref:Nephrocystin 3-like N-terminal domain-containing protein n=1 Tax=Fusarium duplospermum TaxID=1325734 RepID=A0A428PDB7_9HYPO|nr:hypothetical protein CEP54_011650 [Fusarium duplospermum]
MQSDQTPRDRIQAFNYGCGTQNINLGGEAQNINSGGGHQYNAEIQYFAELMYRFQIPGPSESVPPLQGTLISLAFLEMDSRPNKIDDAVEGTCEWLAQHKTYRDWARRHSGLLWIKGKPGSGKSTLLKHVLRKVEAEPGMRDKAIILSFFLHGRGGELQKTPLGLFRSLLHQLLCQVMRDLKDLLDLKKLLDQVIPDRKILFDGNNLFHLDRVLHDLRELLDRDKLLDRGKLLDLDGRLDQAKLHELKELLDRVLHDLKELLHLNKLLSLNSIRERNPLQGLVAMFERQRETLGDPGEKWQWHAPELLGFFESSLPKVLEKWPIWLFVDALDECGKENAIYLIKNFQALIKNLPPTTYQFRICFSCRHYPILQLDYGSAICMEHENMRDIAAFVHAQLSTSHIRSTFEIADTISRRASGVFMWARLVVERVLALELGGEGLKNMEAEIQRIPPDLDALYDGLIQSMEKKATSRRLIEWICFSTKPLSIDQPRWTMVIDPDCPHKSLQQCQQSAEYTRDNEIMERRIKTLSCGLAETVQSSDSRTVQFIHQSAKDFIIEKGLLILADLDGGHEAIIKLLLDTGKVNINARDGEFGRTPLWWAAEEGHMAVVTLLLNTDNVDVDARDTDSRTLLWRAAEKGDRTIARLLLDTGKVDTNARDREFGRTLLSWAAKRGNVAVVELLFGSDNVDVDARDNLRHRTPLSWAAQGGHKDVVKLLLDTGNVDFNARDRKFNRTPLWWARLGGCGYSRLIMALPTLNRGRALSEHVCKF